MLRRRAAIVGRILLLRAQLQPTDGSVMLKKTPIYCVARLGQGFPGTLNGFKALKFKLLKGQRVTAIIRFTAMAPIAVGEPPTGEHSC